MTPGLCCHHGTQWLCWRNSGAGPLLVGRHAPRIRLGVRCTAASDNRSLRNLESLLGEELSSSDSNEESAFSWERARLSDKQIKKLNKAGFHELNTDLTPPKVPPTLCFVLYYWHVVIFLAAKYLDAVEGLGAGDDYMATLVNDHWAVLQDGELLRLLTSPFVHPSPWALFVTLFALAVVGAELESVLGYWVFGAFYALMSVTTGLEEAAVDEFPITQGSLPVIAALVGGLLVSYAKMVLFEQQAKRAKRAQRTAVAGGAVADVSRLQPSTSSSSGGGGSSSPQQRPHTHEEEEEREVEVEFFEGLYKVTVTTTAPLQAASVILTAGVGAFEALYDLSHTGGVSTTWLGVLTGLTAGMVLAWGIAPAWTVDRVSWHTAMATLTADTPRPFLPWNRQPAAESNSTTIQPGEETGGGAWGDEAVQGGGTGGSGTVYPDMLHVRDAVPFEQKAASLVMAVMACGMYGVMMRPEL